MWISFMNCGPIFMHVIKPFGLWMKKEKERQHNES